MNNPLSILFIAWAIVMIGVCVADSKNKESHAACVQNVVSKAANNDIDKMLDKTKEVYK